MDFSDRDLPPGWKLAKVSFTQRVLRRVLMPLFRILAWSEYGRSRAATENALKRLTKNLRTP